MDLSDAALNENDKRPISDDKRHRPELEANEERKKDSYWNDAYSCRRKTT